MIHSIPYVPLSNRCLQPGPDESVIPVIFEGRKLTNATFDGVSYNFEINDKFDNAVISGEVMYFPRYEDIDSDESPGGKRRRYTQIEITRPQSSKPQNGR